MAVKVEFIGMVPPCKRCKQTEENARKAAEKLKKEGVDVVVEKLDIMSPEVQDRFGVLMSPSVVVDSVIRINGKVPDRRVMERLIREAL